MELVEIHHYLWEIPKQGGMLVPGRTYISAPMLEELREDPALTQIAKWHCQPDKAAHVQRGLREGGLVQPSPRPQGVNYGRRAGFGVAAWPLDSRIR